MKFIKKNFYTLFIITFLVVMPIVSLAQTNPSNPDASTNPSAPAAPTRLKNPLGETTMSIPELIQKILEGALKIGMPIIALAIIYCGFLFVSARGKPEAITKAKDALLYTLIGAAILLGSWAIATLIANTVTSLGS